MIFYFLRVQIKPDTLVPRLALQIFQNNGNMIYPLIFSNLKF